MKYLCASILLLATCGSAQRRDVPSAPRPASISWQSVPADSAFVYATERPFSQLPWPGNDDVGYVALGRRVHELEVQGVDARKQLPPYHAKVLEGLQLLGQDYKIDDAALDRMGIGAGSRLLIHTIGTSPVARIEVQRAEYLRPVLHTLFSKLKLDAVERQWQGRPYWEFSQENYTVLLILGDSELIAALSWQGDPALLVSSLMSPTKEPVDRAQVLARISDRTETGDYIGYIDSAVSLKLFMQFVTSRVAMTPRKKSVAEQATCDRELADMVSAVPRFWMSGTISRQRARGILFVDLEASWAQSLQAMLRPSPVAKGHTGKTPFARFSMGLDVGRALSHLRNVLTSLSESSYQCADYKSLSASAVLWKKSVQALSLSPLAGLSGVSGVIQSRHFDTQDNLELQALMTIAHASPDSLFNLMRLIPQARLPANLLKGAAAVPFFVQPLSELGPTEIAIGENALGITVGMAKELREQLAANETDDSTLLSLHLGPGVFALEEEDQKLEGVYDQGLVDALFEIMEGGIVPNMNSAALAVRSTALGVELRYEMNTSD